MIILIKLSVALPAFTWLTSDNFHNDNSFDNFFDHDHQMVNKISAALPAFTRLTSDYLFENSYDKESANGCI